MLSTGAGIVMRSLLLGIAPRVGSMFTLGKESDKTLQIEPKMVKKPTWKTGSRYGPRTSENLIRMQGATVGADHADNLRQTIILAWPQIPNDID